MNADRLYKKLDGDFDIQSIRDDWSFMDLNGYITPSFKEKFMGLVLDNSSEIQKVYTATFPDTEILNKIFKRGERDILLFSHHAMGYTGSTVEFPFYSVPVEHLEEMRKRRIAFYMLHAPLDKNGPYSTSVSLAKALNLEITGEFCQCDNIKVGVLCRTKFTSVSDFVDHVREIIGHEIRLRPYGEPVIRNGTVAVAAGGGSYPFVAEELAELGVNTYLTGFTRPLPHFEPTMEFHRIAEKSHINVIGATHYSTEKYACIAMTNYFVKLGLPAEFIPGKYHLEDL